MSINFLLDVHRSTFLICQGSKSPPSPFVLYNLRVLLFLFSSFVCFFFLERFSTECRKTQTKPVTYRPRRPRAAYQLETTQSIPYRSKTKTRIKVIFLLLSTPNWKPLYVHAVYFFFSFFLNIRILKVTHPVVCNIRELLKLRTFYVWYLTDLSITVSIAGSNSWS